MKLESTSFERISFERVRSSSSKRLDTISRNTLIRVAITRLLQNRILSMTMILVGIRTGVVAGAESRGQVGHRVKGLAPM